MNTVYLFCKKQSSRRKEVREESVGTESQQYSPSTEII